MSIDFPALARQLIFRVDTLLAELLPGGRRTGDEYVVVNPLRGDDHHPGSFKVNVRFGVWADFATDAKGGDLISLYAYVHGLRQGEAAHQLIERFDLGNHRSGNGTGRAPDHSYGIRDLDGKLIATHQRIDAHGDQEKTMWWEVGGRKSLGGLKTSELPLYGTELVNGWSAGDTVVLVEGEKCAERLRRMGIKALATVTGAPNRPDAGPLRVLIKFAELILWPDHDGSGDTQMRRVAGVMVTLGYSRERLRWLDPEKVEALEAEGADCADLSDDAIRDAFESAVGPLPLLEPNAEPVQNAGKVKWNPALVAGMIEDSGDRFAQDGSGLLYRFTNGTYKPDGAEHVRRRVQQILPPDRWNSHFADETVEYIRVRAPHLWERPPIDTLNVLNGLQDVRTKQLRAHSPEFLSPVQLPVRYDPEAKCPTWEKQIADTLPEGMAEVLWQIVAWLMLPIVHLQKALLFIGGGGTGKSTLLEAFCAFLGHAHISSATLQDLENNRFATSGLIGKLANICGDLPSRDLETSAMFKRVVDGKEAIQAERKFRPSFSTLLFARLAFSANQYLRSKDATDAFFQRWIVIAFEKVFRGMPQEILRNKLDAMLAAPGELSGVLNKALEALPRVIEHA